MMNLFNVTSPTLEQWQALERLKAEAYERGREAGFRAGFVAAQQQPQAKIEAAYEQGKQAGHLERSEDGLSLEPVAWIHPDTLNMLKDGREGHVWARQGIIGQRLPLYTKL